MNNCEACGLPVKGGISIGGTLLCRPCAADIQSEIETLRQMNQPVSVMRIARRRFREENSGGDYLLRDIPKALKAQAEHRAIDEDISLRGLMLKALEEYLKNE